MERQTSEHQELASTGAGQRPGAVPEKGSVREIEKRFDKLKSSIQLRLQRIHEGEVATQQQDMLLQKRMEGLYDREQQVTERETAVLQREQQLHAEHSKLSQLQSELQQQYVCLMTSLPLLLERLHSAHKSLPTYAAAADSLDNSHANLAVLSHQLLMRPTAAPNQSDEAAFQEANIRQSQHSKGTPDGHQCSLERKNDVSQTDAVAQQVKPDLHEVQAQQPSSSLLQRDIKQAAQAEATPVAHVAQRAASISAALRQQPTSSAQEASAQGLSETNAIPPWEARGAPDASNAQPVQVAKRKRGPSHKSGSKKTLSKHQSQQLPTTAPDAKGSPAGMQAPAPTATAPTVSTSAPLSAVGPGSIPEMSSVPNGTLPKFEVAVPDSRPAAQPSAGMQSHLAPVRTRSGAAGGHSSLKASANGESLGSPRASAEALATLKGGNDLGSPTSSSRGRGGLFGRNRRGRGRSQLSRPGDQSLAGDLDEAVQALKATTGGTDSPRNIDSNPQHASGALTDDDLKPAFMRRLTSDKLQPDGTVTTEEAQLMGTLQARQGGELDVNPRPVSRRRLDRAAIARKAAATAVLKSEVPDLLDLLQQKGLADEVDVLDPSSSNSEQQEASSVYDKMHAILGRVCEGKAGSSWQGRGLNAGKMAGVDGEDGKHEYCLLALEHLVERAQAYSSGCEPVQWGWCRELTSFVFIFESANRIVVEKPNYGHATYFFDLEEPLPVADQVKRLIAVLSVPGVSRRKLLEGTSLDPGPDVTLQERKQLEAAGWTPGTTIRSLLNFSGDRIFHQSADTMTGQKAPQLYTADYKEKIAKVLSEGAGGGRITKATAT